jgi:hypothetical protein
MGGLNNKQRWIILSGLAVVICLALFPPFDYPSFAWGYRLVFVQNHSGSHLDYPRFLIPMVVVVLTTAVGVLLTSKPKDPPDTPVGKPDAVKSSAVEPIVRQPPDPFKVQQDSPQLDKVGSRIAVAVAVSLVSYAILGLILPVTVFGGIVKLIGNVAIGVGFIRLAKGHSAARNIYRAELVWAILFAIDGAGWIYGGYVAQQNLDLRTDRTNQLVHTRPVPKQNPLPVDVIDGNLLAPKQNSLPEAEINRPELQPKGINGPDATQKPEQRPDAKEKSPEPIRQPDQQADAEEKWVRDEARAEGAIKAMGGDVNRARLVPGKPIVYVYLTGQKVTDAGLKDLAALQSLRHLDLGKTEITDAGLKELGTLLRLQRLNLWHTKVTDAGLHELTVLKNLEHLDLAETEVTEVGIAKLQKALPNCKVER